jgi:lipoate-protein ligase A
MEWIEITLSAAAENLALDEACLEAAEQGQWSSGLLRIWEPSVPMVIVGRASRVHEEVNEAFCAAHRIPIFRRVSGGAAVVALPGCLMYAVILPHATEPAGPELDLIHARVLAKIGRAVQRAGCDASRQGTSDLVWQNRKISGNSLRVKRAALLYHGTILYDADLELIGRCLQRPPREPAYRRARSHLDFLANAPAARDRLVAGLVEAWEATASADFRPPDRLASLVADKYGCDDWNQER